jgi:hypothetical protein
MGGACCSSESGADNGSRRQNNQQFTQNDKIKKYEVNSDDDNNNNNKGQGKNENNNKKVQFEQSPKKNRHLSVDGNQQQQQSPVKINNADDDFNEGGEVRPATTKFLRHVNGSQTHSVARVLFEQWLVILNAIENDENNNNTQDDHRQSENQKQDADQDCDIDGFGNGNNNNNNKGNINNNNNRSNRSRIVTSTQNNSENNNNTNTQKINNNAAWSIFLNPKNFGPGVELAQVSTSHTRLSKWATQHPSEAVTHQSVEEIVQDFLPALQEEIGCRGWSGEVEYEQEGFDSNGVVSVSIILVNKNNEQHTFEISVEYHAVCLI